MTTTPAENVQVLIAVPTMGGIHPMLASRLILWAQKFKGHVHFYFSFKVAPVDRARNQIVEKFLEMRVGEDKLPLTHLFMIDSDTIPNEEALGRLLGRNLDIVSGLTPILHFNKGDKDYEVYDNCFIRGDVETETGKVLTTNIVQRNTGLQEIFRCGASCILIKREVFDKVGTPAFNFVPNAENTLHTRSEDIDFCDRARNAGFKLYADSEVICGHYKDIML